MALGIDLRRMQANDRLAAHVLRQLLHFRVGPFSLHRRERTASVKQVAAGGDTLCELCERARNHHRKERRRTPSLDTPFVHFDVPHAELNRRLAQERRFLQIAFDEMDGRVGPICQDTGADETWKTAARADIDEIVAAAEVDDYTLIWWEVRPVLIMDQSDWPAAARTAPCGCGRCPASGCGPRWSGM